MLAEMMDHLDISGRFAVLKLATGGLRVGVSSRLAKTALAQAFDVPVDDIEESWHALTPPYATLFDWLEGRSGRPDPAGTPFFRPFMLAHPLEEASVDLKDYAAEWKWDGIRVQIVGTGGETRLYSRAGDDITGSFPDVAEAFSGHGVLDGELLVKGDVQGAEAHGGAAASFNALQHRTARRPLVQMEARSADCRLRDDVCTAGAWKAFVLLFGLHLWMLDRGWRIAAGGQSLFRVYRRGTQRAGPFRAEQHRQPLRPGARGGKDAGAGSRVRFDP